MLLCTYFTFSTVLKKILFLTIVVVLGFFTFFFRSFIPPSVMAQSAPSAPSDVLVEYPACEGASCSTTQAKCAWGAANGAASYTVKITEVDTNTVVTTRSFASSVFSYTFSVTSGKTYKCDVNAVNASGASGAVGSYSLLCQTDVVSTTPTPATATPTTAIPTPTKTPIPTTKVVPPVSGNETPLIIAGIFGLGILLLGGLLFAL